MGFNDSYFPSFIDVSFCFSLPQIFPPVPMKPDYAYHARIKDRESLLPLPEKPCPAYIAPMKGKDWSIAVMLDGSRECWGGVGESKRQKHPLLLIRKSLPSCVYNVHRSEDSIRNNILPVHSCLYKCIFYWISSPTTLEQGPLEAAPFVQRSNWMGLAGMDPWQAASFSFDGLGKQERTWEGGEEGNSVKDHKACKNQKGTGEDISGVWTLQTLLHPNSNGVGERSYLGLFLLYLSFRKHYFVCKVPEP